jgi:hypothetical protein
VGDSTPAVALECLLGTGTTAATEGSIGHFATLPRQWQRFRPTSTLHTPQQHSP